MASLAERLGPHIREQIIGAILSVLIIWLLTGVLVYEAIQRIVTPEDVDGVLQTWLRLNVLITPRRQNYVHCCLSRVSC